jgi:hypothetical protein
MCPLDSDLDYRAVVVIAMPDKVNDYIPWAFAKYDKMNGNTRYSSLAAKLLTFDADNKKLRDAQTGCTSKPRTVTTETRNNCWNISKADIRILAGNVQEMADLDTENAVLIITDAGFEVKHVPIPQKKKNTAVDGPEEGEVILTGEGRGPHNWRVSKDQENWTILLASKTGTKKSKGHTPDDVLYFQNSLLVNEDEDPIWSPSVRIRVKKH